MEDDDEEIIYTDIKPVVATSVKEGILVVFSVRLEGGVHYNRRDLKHEQVDRKDKLTWETRRIITDKVEYREAERVRSAARYEVTKVCVNTGAFGLICPVDQELDLDIAVSKARAKIDEFNESSVYTKITMHLIKGRFVSSDEEAVAAVSYEVKGLLGKLEAALRSADPDAIRAAAKAAREMAPLLDDNASEAVSAAVAEARLAARTIVRRVEDAAEDAADVAREANPAAYSAIAMARFAVLGTDEDTTEYEPEGSMPSVSVQRFANLADEEDE